MRWVVVLAWVAVGCQRSAEVRREDAGTVAAAAAPAEFPWTLSWVQHVGTPHYEAFHHLATTSDDGVVVAGNYGDKFVLGSHTLRANEVSVFGGALYLAKISASGEWQWARSFDGKGANYIAAVAVGKDGKIWLGGDYEQTVNGLGLGPSRSRTPFVVRLSAEGVAETKSRFTTEGYDSATLSSLALLDDGVLVAGAVNGGFSAAGSAHRCADRTGVLVARFAEDGELRFARCLDAPGPYKGHGPQVGAIDGRAAMCLSGDNGIGSGEQHGLRVFPLSLDGTPGAVASGGSERDECHAVFPLADGIVGTGWTHSRDDTHGLWRVAGTQLQRLPASAGTATPALRLSDGRFVIAVQDGADRRLRRSRLVIFSASLVPGASLALPAGLDPEALAITRSGALILGAGFSGDVELAGKTYSSIPDRDTGVQLPTDALLLRFEPRTATRPSP